MPESTDMDKNNNRTEEGLEDAHISPPKVALDHAHPSPNEADANAIPQFFIDAILEVIAETIEQALAKALSRYVGESIKRDIHPLIEEIALLRVAIEHDWTERHRRTPTRTDGGSGR